MNTEGRDAVNVALAAHEIDLLLVSPDRLANARFAERARGLIRAVIGLFVADVAHCSPTGATTSDPTIRG